MRSHKGVSKLLNSFLTKGTYTVMYCTCSPIHYFFSLLFAVHHCFTSQTSICCPFFFTQFSSFIHLPHSPSPASQQICSVLPTHSPNPGYPLPRPRYRPGKASSLLSPVLSPHRLFQRWKLQRSKICRLAYGFL